MNRRKVLRRDRVINNKVRDFKSQVSNSKLGDAKPVIHSLNAMLSRVSFLGCIPLEVDNGVPPVESDLKDIRTFIRRPWRKTAFYRYGVPTEAQINIDDKDMLKLSMRTFPPDPPSKFEVSVCVCVCVL